jgi:hypothetical protein
LQEAKEALEVKRHERRWWFYAAGTRTTDALKQSAKQRGNFIIDNAFATHPGFTIV